MVSPLQTADIILSMDFWHLNDAEFDYELSIRSSDLGARPADTNYLNRQTLQEELNECTENIEQLIVQIDRCLRSGEVDNQFRYVTASRLVHYEQRLGRIGLGYEETIQQRIELLELRVQVESLMRIMRYAIKSAELEEVVQTGPTRATRYEQLRLERRFEMLMGRIPVGTPTEETEDYSGHSMHSMPQETEQPVQEHSADLTSQNASGSEYQINQSNHDQESDDIHNSQNGKEPYGEDFDGYSELRKPLSKNEEAELIGTHQ